MIDIRALHDAFISKINSMSADELLASARRAEEMAEYAHFLDGNFFESPAILSQNTLVQTITTGINTNDWQFSNNRTSQIRFSNVSINGGLAA